MMEVLFVNSFGRGCFMMIKRGLICMTFVGINEELGMGMFMLYPLYHLLSADPFH
jgi:hypothetical protein